MKRDNIEFIVGWLDTLRRDDREALLATLDPGIVWHGLKRNGSANGPDKVVSIFAVQRDAARELDALELIGAEGHAILHARGARTARDRLDNGICNVFAIEEQSVHADQRPRRAPACARGRGFASG